MERHLETCASSRGAAGILSAPARSRAGGLSRIALVLASLATLAGCSHKPTRPVIIPPLSRVTLNVHVDTLQVNEVHILIATAFDTLGHAVSDVPFTWTSSDLSVATVSTSGSVLGVGEGVARIVAEAGGRRDSATVFVFPGFGWIAETSNASENLNDVFFLSSGRTGWVVGDNGVVLKSRDAGVTWTRQTPTTADLHGVWFTGATEGWAVGSTGQVLHTLDGGDSWADTSLGAAFTFNDVVFATPDTGWVVGASGAIFHTFDRGRSWTQQLPTVTISNLHSLSFAGTRDGWAVGDNGTLVGTHDGGRSWYLFTPSGTAQRLNAVLRRSNTLALAVGAGGVVLRSSATQDSLQWAVGNAGAFFTLLGVAFPTSTLAYASGSNAGVGAILRSDDGGANWHTQTVSSQFRLNRVTFVDALRGWAVGDAGTIRHTARGGQ